MNILVFNSSPRKNKNTANFVKAFVEGAKENNEVTQVNLADYKINGCIACAYCRGKGEGTCIQKDDMQKIYPLIEKADMIVFASPVYYWSFSSQMQTLITRFYAKGNKNAKKFGMILSSFSPDVYDGIVYQYKRMIKFFDAEDMGYITFCGGEQLTEENLNKAKNFGLSLNKRSSL